eukprot:scaffold17529_cov72-Skeletonema_dohrnii-CCMP3373.AAC.4
MSPAPQSAEPIRMAAGKGQPRQEASGGGRGRGAGSSGSFQANKRRCKFFFSNKGCRRGSDCRYSHESDENELDAAQASTSSSSANNDAPCSTVLISASENESDDEIAHEKQARHCKKKALQDMTRGGRSSPNNGRWSPQDRNDKNSRPASSETFTSISESSLSTNNTLQCVHGTEHGTNVIILEGLQSQVQVAMKQLAVLQTHANLLQASLLQMSEQVNSASSSIIMNRSSMNKHDSSIIGGRDEKVGRSNFTGTVVDNEDRDPVEEPAEFGRSKNRGGRRNCTESVIVSTRNNGSRGQQSTYEMVQPVNIDE